MHEKTQTSSESLNQDLLWTTKEVAQRLKCSESKLEKDRFLGQGLPYTRLGKKVLYRETDLRRYLDANTVGGNK